jgi:hypothetical protein
MWSIETVLAIIENRAFLNWHVEVAAVGEAFEAEEASSND